jgi:hypothetical protein
MFGIDKQPVKPGIGESFYRVGIREADPASDRGPAALYERFQCIEHKSWR